MMKHHVFQIGNKTIRPKQFGNANGCMTHVSPVGGVNELVRVGVFLSFKEVWDHNGRTALPW